MSLVSWWSIGAIVVASTTSIVLWCEKYWNVTSGTQRPQRWTSMVMLLLTLVAALVGIGGIISKDSESRRTSKQLTNQLDQQSHQYQADLHELRDTVEGLRRQDGEELQSRLAAIQLQIERSLQKPIFNAPAPPTNLVVTVQ